ncbi:outer membrane protein assembly factor BamB family protein [Gordonia sp. FQ]|uniref:outer membrane protein assembly factor BamB family protein n=1 Tax=Gordonia sp. FQ TaxID=3446634 RepID=UPI003F868A50
MTMAVLSIRGTDDVTEHGVTLSDVSRVPTNAIILFAAALVLLVGAVIAVLPKLRKDTAACAILIAAGTALLLTVVFSLYFGLPGGDSGHDDKVISGSARLRGLAAFWLAIVGLGAILGWFIGVVDVVKAPIRRSVVLLTAVVVGVVSVTLIGVVQPWRGQPADTSRVVIDRIRIPDPAPQAPPAAVKLPGKELPDIVSLSGNATIIGSGILLLDSERAAMFNLDGSVRWTANPPGGVGRSFSIGSIPEAGVVLIATRAGLSGIDARTGRTLWERAPEDMSRVYPDLARVYPYLEREDGLPTASTLTEVVDLGRALLILDPRTGKPRHRHEFAADCAPIRVSDDAGGVVVEATCVDDHFYEQRIDGATGAAGPKRWYRRMGGLGTDDPLMRPSTTESPVITLADQVLTIKDGRLVVTDRKTHRVQSFDGYVRIYDVPGGVLAEHGSGRLTYFPGVA